jgi:catechol 2,3-dioxygenase-like lactoylglutathione lyase family enzyme
VKNNWEHGHVGVFTRDFEKTIQYYQSLGIAPAPLPRPPRNPADKFVNVEFGKVTGPNPPGLPLELLYIGNLEFEILHAPKERPSGEALAYGEGVNHVMFNVPDIDGETDRLVAKGLRIIQDARRNDARVEDYLDTREFGNILLSFRPLQTEEAKAKKAGYGIVKWNFLGIGAVVKDVDKTVKYYQAMGVGEALPTTVFDSTQVKNAAVYGKPAGDAIKAKIRLLQIGPTAYELVQPVEGKAIYKESLDRRGEGVINLAFAVNDLEKETANLVKKGVKVAFSGKPQAGNAFAYLDTRKDGGDVMMKLVQK